MASRLHQCPHCGAVGKVHRSIPRNRGEKILRFLLPVYGTYRCHNCNWRGWLPRGGTSVGMRRLLVGLYVTIVLVALAYAVAVFVERWPRAEYQYPIPTAR